MALGVLSPSLPPHPSLPSSLRLAVGRQTTAPASVSAVAGTTAGIVEQGESPPPSAPPCLSLSLGTIKRALPPPPPPSPPHPSLFLISPSKSVLTKLLSPSLLFPRPTLLRCFAKVSGLESPLGRTPLHVSAVPVLCGRDLQGRDGGWLR